MLLVITGLSYMMNWWRVDRCQHSSCNSNSFDLEWHQTNDEADCSIAAATQTETVILVSFRAVALKSN